MYHAIVFVTLGFLQERLRIGLRAGHDQLDSLSLSEDPNAFPARRCMSREPRKSGELFGLLTRPQVWQASNSSSLLRHTDATPSDPLSHHVSATSHSSRPHSFCVSRSSEPLQMLTRCMNVSACSLKCSAKCSPHYGTGCRAAKISNLSETWFQHDAFIHL